MTNLSNTALDAIFEPRGSSTKRANVNLQTAGVDISNRYYDIAQGGTIPASNTNIQSGGTDIRNLFAEVGTVSYLNLTWDDNAPSISASDSGLNLAIASLTIKADGSATKTSVGTVSDWLSSVASGNGDGYECKATHVSGNTIAGNLTFEALTVDKDFVLSANGSSGDKSAVYDIEIREIANTSNTQTVQVYFDAVITGGGIIL